MKIVLIIVASLVLLTGIVFSRIQNRNVLNVSQEQVLSENSEEVVANKGDEIDEINLPDNLDPTGIPTPKPTLLPAPEADINMSLKDYVYPGSNLVSSSNNSLALTTSDDPDRVTDWYKEKITSQDMNVKSFITTKANEKVLNKLVGAKEGLEISIEIRKDEGSSICEVSVNLNNY